MKTIPDQVNTNIIDIYFVVLVLIYFEFTAVSRLIIFQRVIYSKLLFDFIPRVSIDLLFKILKIFFEKQVLRADVLSDLIFVVLLINLVLNFLIYLFAIVAFNRKAVVCLIGLI